MTQSSDTAAPISNTFSNRNWLWSLLFVGLALLVFIYRQGLIVLLSWWEAPEYSHGYMIPLVAIFLLYQRLNQLPTAMKTGSWSSLPLLLIGLFLYAFGTLSHADTLIQYGFLISVFALSLAFIGSGGMRLLWAVPLYLIFMIPLPSFFYLTLSNKMQLLSSEIGVSVIRLAGISVYLEGNVIDLGAMKLQVAEACSGMRYLFPLMSFGFLIAYILRGPIWQKIALFISTIPITILMNSFRIGVIGITVDKWGKEMAQGFLHDFEGWVVFMACIAALFLEIAMFHFFRRDNLSLIDRINLELPALQIKSSDFRVNTRNQRPFIVCLAIIFVSLPMLLSIKEREEIIPKRKDFLDFPMTHHGWVGKASPLDHDVLDILKLTDYLQANYVYPQDSINPINLYIAWYDSQRKGSTMHSPRLCIPGGGWVIDEIKTHEVLSVNHVNGKPLSVNRALIKKFNTTQLVYYWFEGRNRDITDEYFAKWYVLQDFILDRRSDGALVRVTTSVPDGTSIEFADARLEQFLRSFYPLLPAHIP